MRTKLIAAALLLCFGCFFSAMSVEKGKLSDQQIQLLSSGMHKMLNDRSYTVNIGTATPMDGGPMQATAVLIIDGEKVTSQLPYLGQGNNTFAGESTAYRFDGTITAYEITPGKKKGEWRVKIDVLGPKDDTYKFSLKTFYNGQAYVNLVGGGLQPMNYSGVIVKGIATETGYK